MTDGHAGQEAPGWGLDGGEKAGARIEQSRALSYALEEALKQHGKEYLAVQEDQIIIVWQPKDTIAHSSVLEA